MARFGGRNTEPAFEPPMVAQIPLHKVLREASQLREDGIAALGRRAVAAAMVPDEVAQYRPKTTAETVTMVGDKVAESMSVMFDRIATDVRARAQEVVDKALEAQKQADRFCSDLQRIGEWHSSGLKKATEECVGLLELIEQQKKLFNVNRVETLPALENGNGGG